jgi:uncharacterized protein (TIGR02444 family)
MTSGEPDELWEFVCAVYGRPGVADALIALQDGHGVDVNVILFAGWLGRMRGIRLRNGDVAELRARSKVWNESVVQGLRGLRRLLKTTLPGVDAGAQEMLRNGIKANELAAERVELEMLQSFSGGFAFAAAPGSDAGAENMATALASYLGEDPAAEAWRKIALVQAAAGHVSVRKSRF